MSDSTGVFQPSYAAAIEVTRDHFHALAQGLPNACFYLNTDLKVEFVNEEFARPFGKSFEEILGHRLDEIFGAEEFARHEQYLKQALAGEPVTYETRVGDETREVFLRISNKPIFDDAGAVKGIFSEATDITSLRQLERRARESESRFRMIAEGVPSHFIFLDRGLRIQFANEAFLKAAGWTQAEAVGRHISEALTPEQYLARRAHYEQALAGEEVFYESHGAAGSESGYFRFWYRPNLDSAGRVKGLFSMAMDISERHEMELELQRKQAELVRSNHDLEQFAYVASHDLKAPLRSIEVLVQWIREELVNYDEGGVQENLDLLSNRTRRLSRLLDDLLNYSRAGRKIGELKVTDCAELVRDVVQLTEPPPNISVELNGTFPICRTYPTPLEQVFRNLIGNAIKHHGDGDGLITVSCAEQGEHYLFTVRDNGPGIPEEYADRVFEMFQTLKPRDQVEGSGMGLAIVNRIVTSQGGRVWLEQPESGTGAVFRFTWAKQASEDAEYEVAQA